MVADPQRGDLRLAWLARTRADLEQARSDAYRAGVDLEQVGPRLDRILLRLVPPPGEPEARAWLDPSEMETLGF